MYKDFTNSAESMRRERYRVASTTMTRMPDRGLRATIGLFLMRMGERLTGTPAVRTEIEAASV